MTKRNLLLASLLLVFGLGTASSMLAVTGIVFGGSNNTNYYIRNEGDAEGVGTISLGTTSTGTIKVGSALYITYNVPLATDGTNFAVSVSCTGDFAATICNNLTMSVATSPWNSTPTEPVQGTPTMNQVVLSFNTDTILGTPTNGTQINVAARVMAQGLPYGYGVYGTVRAYYQFSQYPMTVNPLYPAAYELAEVGATQALSIAAGDMDWRKGALVTGPEYVLTCIGIKDIPDTLYDHDFDLLLTENWADALTSLSDEDFLEQYPPPAANYVSSGPIWDPTPTNGSNILITLAHIPPGVGIHGRQPIACDPSDSSAPLYCLNGNLAIESPIADAMVASTDGTFTQNFFYWIDSTNVAVIESALFGFKLWSHGPLAPNMNYQITAQVSLVDSDPSDGPPDTPYFTAAEAPVLSVVEFKDCVTKLLFPYVNSFIGGGSHAFSNFGTGIAVANTTVDPFALPAGTCDPTSGAGCTYPDEARGSAVPQSGSCLFYFYPSNASAPVVATTPSLDPGASYIFDVATLAPGFRGKQGYAIAICNFQNAHAFAEIYDNYGLGDPTATLAYLADILPEPAFYRRSPAGDGLGEGAIAPVNIQRTLQKLLMYGNLGGFGASVTTK